MQRLLSMLLLSIVVVTSACDDDDPVSPAGEAEIRFVNASPTVGPVDVLIGNTVVAQNLAFQEASACVTVDAGVRTVAYRANGTIVDQVTIPFLDAEEYLGVSYDDPLGETLVDATFTDPPVPAAGVNALRFINVTAETGDVYVTEPGATPSGLPEVEALAPEGLTTWQAIATSETLARLFEVGTTTDAFASAAIPALTNSIGTVLFTGAATTGGSTGFVVEPCI